MANIAVNVWDFGPLETVVVTLLHKMRISTAKIYFKTRNTCIAEPREARGGGEAHKGWEDKKNMK